MHGDANNAWHDHETGKLAWRALTCRNPACPGRGSQGGPDIFVHAPAGAVLDAAGDVHVPGVPQPAVPPCPKCGKHESVCEYELPEIAKRRAELEEELLVSRATRRRAAAPPAGVRPPMEIIKDLTLLPRLYLIPDAQAAATPRRLKKRCMKSAHCRRRSAVSPDGERVVFQGEPRALARGGVSNHKPSETSPQTSPGRSGVKARLEFRPPKKVPHLANRWHAAKPPLRLGKWAVSSPAMHKA